MLKLVTFIRKIDHVHLKIDIIKGVTYTSNTFFTKIILFDGLVAHLDQISIKIQILSILVNFYTVKLEKMLTDPLKTVVQ